MKPTDLMLVSAGSNRTLAEAIAREMGKTLSGAEVVTFADGETSISIEEPVRGNDVFIIQPTCKPVNDTLMQLLIMIDACRRASAKRITAVVPYYGYARQDRKAKSRDPISAKLVANLITEAGADRVLTCDLHADQIQGFFDIPLDNLLAVYLFAPVCKARIGNGENYIVVSPDIGAVKRSRKFADVLDLPLAIVEKQRAAANLSEVMNVIGDVAGKHCLMIDDIVDTAGSLTNAAKALKSRGALSVDAYATHGVLSSPAIERVRDGQLDSLTLTDTIPYPATAPACGKVQYVSFAGIIGESIKRIHEESSLASLFAVRENTTV
ncbi:MAG: ribose-phosphate pyrophosphokinase [Oscillospiraceae bacterium]|jgi:ribose-phosphate pyrophosphokinase|nr:ribose-phosphate pyrophosphokinase [Oscillospiraceae bacterium]